MVSGKFSALAGAVAREQAMANIANNLANVNTSGFKKDTVSFEAMLRGERQTSTTKGINYNRVRTIATDFSQGPIKTTDNPLDLAIDGEGFFKIGDSSGTYYTRQGSFRIDGNGLLKTASGHSLLDAGGQPLQVNNPNSQNITIDEAGNVAIDGGIEGKISIYQVDDTANLEKIGHSLFRLGDAGAEIPLEEYRIVQGGLETSNVNMMEEMVRMIDTNRKHAAYHKVMKSYSTMSEKLDELGSVG